MAHYRTRQSMCCSFIDCIRIGGESPPASTADDVGPPAKRFDDVDIDDLPTFSDEELVKAEPTSPSRDAGKRMEPDVSKTPQIEAVADSTISAKIEPVDERPETTADVMAIATMEPTARDPQDPVEAALAHGEKLVAEGFT